jgi:hypothetical protein
MMAVDPDKRPQSAEALIAEICKLLPSLPESDSSMRPAYRVSASNTPISLSAQSAPASAFTDDIELLARPGSAPQPARTAPKKVEEKKMGLWQRIVASFNMLMGR